ncbi:type II toxin-antitoxin system Phd/YefM family antitoxin [Tetragenococcus koreensis]|uniref:type II toxin-antitoxin system Phd/YefM family antitoxin n=1 Tax=Tetragenococcus koreensis TaxID=290335 RepID=UPI000F4EA4CE|nr:type II toxin-antitoxin system prevent-host-death family antitoxin [Tetragenococcus koreensis]AYW46594.1 prevent-host-death protein [Tetragenococcus koreensis]MCF1585630.1 type II toxin-antitoxin system Phd/YefM family antitoxin [Tetragenococcus koreensis]MCF1615174.1 type II toxin-antitoxin system Phd/YefM family antitoxin [Tetragenococcus koreensis]MCF1617881.1 type II toxin-antitoxin system Phd/YefM family antitoxin [Tetragenococcus koreensis]MCF1620205.1 type II toxin-antitoxin system P
MDHVVPVSELRSYNQMLSEVQEGPHVVLTKNGYAKYVVTDYEEWQKMKATIDLFSELQNGVQSHKVEPSLSLDELKSHTKGS